MKKKSIMIMIMMAVIILFSVVAALFVSFKLKHDCTKNATYLDAIYTDENGNNHTEAICNICNKQLLFINGELQNDK